MIGGESVSGLRCAVGIGGEGVVWRGGRGIGSAVSLGLA